MDNVSELTVTQEDERHLLQEEGDILLASQTLEGHFPTGDIEEHTNDAVGLMTVTEFVGTALVEADVSKDEGRSTSLRS
jgi:hypothetical protein